MIKLDWIMGFTAVGMAGGGRIGRRGFPSGYPGASGSERKKNDLLFREAGERAESPEQADGRRPDE